MADVFKSKSWAIKVPESWTVDDSERAVVLRSQNDISATLAIAAFVKHDGTITMEDMRRAIQSGSNEPRRFSEVRIGDFAGCYSTFDRREEAGDSAWRMWCVFSNDVHLHITFNVAWERKAKHDAIVDEMLRTIMCLREL
jgi:hypothetical protein